MDECVPVRGFVIDGAKWKSQLEKLREKKRKEIRNTHQSTPIREQLERIEKLIPQAETICRYYY